MNRPLLLVFSLSLFALSALAEPVVLSAGSSLPVRLASGISTKTVRSGDLFHANLDRDLVANGQVIARRGAPAQGIVGYATKGGRVKGRASLTLRLTSLQLANGRTVPLTTSLVSRTAHGTKKKDAAKIGGATGLGAAIGAIAGGGVGAGVGAAVGAGAGTGTVLLTRGDQVGFPSESRLTFRLQRPLHLD